LEIAKAYKKTSTYAMERPPVTLEYLGRMRRSKLEIYVGIIKVLVHMGPLKLKHIMYKSNVNGSMLKEYLGFLIKQGLIEERTSKANRVVFAVTQRGITVLKFFEPMQETLIIEGQM
jgi:predicted transcriptional regulator